MSIEEEKMPPGGAKELRESSEGRKYLEKLQKKHELDLLQPGTEKFNQVYGDKIKRDKEEKNRAQAETNSQWMEREDRKRFEERRRGNVNRRYL